LGLFAGCDPKLTPKFSTQKVELTTEAKRRILLLKRGVGSALCVEGLPPSESPSGPAVTPALPESLAPSVTPFFELPEGLSPKQNEAEPFGVAREPIFGDSPAVVGFALSFMCKRGRAFTLPDLMHFTPH